MPACPSAEGGTSASGGNHTGNSSSAVAPNGKGPTQGTSDTRTSGESNNATNGEDNSNAVVVPKGGGPTSVIPEDGEEPWWKKTKQKAAGIPKEILIAGPVFVVGLILM